MRSQHKTWRDIARNRISEVLTAYEAHCSEEQCSMNVSELSKALFKAYPFGRRRYHPYKIWLSEKKRALQYFDLMLSDQRSASDYAHWSLMQLGARVSSPVVAPGQMSLFGG